MRPEALPGARGREWETGKQGTGVGVDGEVRFSSGCGCYFPCSSLVWRGGRDTLLAFSPTQLRPFMKSLQRQGRQGLFLSPN